MRTPLRAPCTPPLQGVCGDSASDLAPLQHEAGKPLCLQLPATPHGTLALEASRCHSCVFLTMSKGEKRKLSNSFFLERTEV